MVAMARGDEKFKEALVGKKIPVLTLDNKWHRLFTKAEFTPELVGMEKNLNELLKRQAKVNTEVKELKKLKKKADGRGCDTCGRHEGSSHEKAGKGDVGAQASD